MALRLTEGLGATLRRTARELLLKAHARRVVDVLTKRRDSPEPARLVQGHGRRLTNACLQAQHGVPELTGLQLKFLQDDHGQPSAARRSGDEHPAYLSNCLLQRSEGSASDRLVFRVRDQVRAPLWCWHVRWPLRIGREQFGVQGSGLNRSFPQQCKRIRALRVYGFNSDARCAQVVPCGA